MPERPPVRGRSSRVWRFLRWFTDQPDLDEQVRIAERVLLDDLGKRAMSNAGYDCDPPTVTDMARHVVAALNGGPMPGPLTVNAVHPPALSTEDDDA
jgi:hypothetical protein